MGKRIISYAIILSIVWMDIVFAMMRQSGGAYQPDTLDELTNVRNTLPGDDAELEDVSAESTVDSNPFSTRFLVYEEEMGGLRNIAALDQDLPFSCLEQDEKEERIENSYSINQEGESSALNHDEKAGLLSKSKASRIQKKTLKSLKQYRKILKSLSKSNDDFEKISPSTYKCLRHMKLYIIDDNSTWWQRIGWLTGFCIGAAKGLAFPSIFLDSLRSPQNPLNDSFEGTDSILTLVLICTTSTIFGSDSMIRNAVLLNDLWGPSTKDFSISLGWLEKWKGFKSLVYTVIAPTSAVPNTYYFFKVQFNNIRAGVNATGTDIFLACLTPGVFLDAGLDTAYHLTRLIRHSEAEARNETYRHNEEEGVANPPEEVIRHTYLSFLKNLRQIIPALSVTNSTAIHELYEEVFISGFGIAATRAGITQQKIDEMKNEDALRILDVLETFYNNSHKDDLEDPHKRMKDANAHLLEEQETAREEAISGIAWAITIAATPARSFLFYFMFQSMLAALADSLGFDSDSADYNVINIIISILLGAGVGATFGQAPIEKMALKEYMQNLFGISSHSEATCFKPLRIIAKALNSLFISNVMLVPLCLTSLDATSDWGWGQLALFLLAPLLISDNANTSFSFNESSGYGITTINRAYSYVKVTLSYKIDKLIRLILRLEDVFQMAHGDVLKDINNIRAKFLKRDPSNVDPMTNGSDLSDTSLENQAEDDNISELEKKRREKRKEKEYGSNTEDEAEINDEEKPF